MGGAVTDAAGAYRIDYRGGDWDLAVPGLTTWRPDIYVTVERRNASGGYTRVARSATHSDHRMRNDLRIDMTIDLETNPEVYRVPGFSVGDHGYHFVNSFVVEPSVIGVSLGEWHLGFCGGMSAGAHHNFVAQRAAPPDQVAPAAGTPLFNELLDRQQKSLSPSIIAKIIQWQASPDEPDPLKPHSLSWRTRQEWPSLYGRLKANKPTSIVLIRVEGVTSDPTRNHQVLAYGYRWAATTKDLELYVYDPNTPGREVTLTMTLAGKNLRARDSSGARLRGFFVNPNGDRAAA